MAGLTKKDYQAAAARVEAGEGSDDDQRLAKQLARSYPDPAPSPTSVEVEVPERDPATPTEGGEEPSPGSSTQRSADPQPTSETSKSGNRRSRARTTDNR